ncbi:hypothetical protein BH09PAT4_BH09PAT4_05920 [soil metagenome]
MLAMAAEGFGLDVSDQQMDDWAAMFGGIYKLDGIVDSDLTERERRVRFDVLLDDVTLAIHDGKPVMDCENTHNCQLCHLRQNLVGRDEFDLVDIGFRLDMLFDYAEKRRHTQKVPALTQLCAGEGRLTASLLEMPTQPGHESETIKFNMLLRNLGAAGTLLDTALDLQEDYENGLCQVPPTKLNKARIISRSLPLLALTYVQMPKALRDDVQASLKEISASTQTAIAAA